MCCVCNMLLSFVFVFFCDKYIARGVSLKFVVWQTNFVVVRLNLINFKSIGDRNRGDTPSRVTPQNWKLIPVGLSLFENPLTGGLSAVFVKISEPIFWVGSFLELFLNGNHHCNLDFSLKTKQECCNKMLQRWSIFWCHLRCHHLYFSL